MCVRGGGWTDLSDGLQTHLDVVLLDQGLGETGEGHGAVHLQLLVFSLTLQRANLQQPKSSIGDTVQMLIKNAPAQYFRKNLRVLTTGRKENSSGVVEVNILPSPSEIHLKTVRERDCRC